MPRLRLSTILLMLVSFWSWTSTIKAETAGDYEFFEKRIRPVLVERCYKCHSAEAQKLKGELFLDSASGMRKGGESGKPAILPGKPDQSLLLEAIRYQNPDLQMPPKEKLPESVVADFEQWIREGAPDPRGDAPPKTALTPAMSRTNHWAFHKPVQSPLPPVVNAPWPRTPIDSFILSKLEQAGLHPSPPADKATLIRRAAYDLTGLPPTPAQVEQFVQDKDSSAYPKLIDRLLASPRYGERWGRYWLDVARYSDTKGYVYTDREEARFVHSYVYRDWVVHAFNRDLPYDQFLVQQLSGDQIAPSSTNPLESPAAGLGYLTLGRRFLGVVHDIIDDRIDVVMRGTQALTVGCARCHDHKFDPIPTADYYSLYGVFAGCTENLEQIDLHPHSSPQFQDFFKDFQARTNKLETVFQQKKEEFSKRFRASAGRYVKAVLSADSLPTEEFYEIRGPNDLNPFIVRRWQAFIEQNQHPHVFGPWLALGNKKGADFRKAFEAMDWSECNPKLARQLRQNSPASMEEVAQAYARTFEEIYNGWEMEKNLPHVSSFLDRSEAYGGRAEAEAAEELRQILYGADSPVQIPNLSIAELEWFFDEGTRVELSKLQSEIDRSIVNATGAPAFTVSLRDKQIIKNPHIFKRGNPANRGAEVPRQFLWALSGPNRKPFRNGSGRLELAKAIASRDNPLTARVMVNRVWLHHFGAGLVRTPSDFGFRCDPPSHPELLDWLAVYFMDHQWSVKELHRLIMLSNVYQQESGEEGSIQTPGPNWALDNTSAKANKPELADPENRLLWRMNRERLDFEALRDSLLAVEGTLDLKMGGRAGDMNERPFKLRRTVYGYIDRQFLPGLLRVFDYANPDMHSPMRAETTVPQQALFFLNGSLVMDSARRLGKEAEYRSSDQTARVDWLYQRVLHRQPQPEEMELAARFLRDSKPSGEPAQHYPASWQYGYGSFNTNSHRVEAFTPLPHFTGEAWQGGPKWPDEKLGWVRLTATGGHAGNDLNHIAIRRWVAPTNLVVNITGALQHVHVEGDGIRARIVASKSGQLAEWILQNRTEQINIPQITLESGETLDFLVDYNANLNNDDFFWAPLLTVTGSGTESRAIADAANDFAGPGQQPAEPLDPWAQYAQVLLLSNEFLFVD